MFKVFLISFVLTVLSLADAPLLKTGQIKSYDQSGTEVADGSVKDDGFYQKGKARSYTRSAAGVVTDKVTKLEWQDNVNPVSKLWVTQANYDDGNYSDTSGDTATTYCDNLMLDNGDWRLPTIEELETIVDDGTDYPTVTENLFLHISFYDYWSSTTTVGYSGNAWFVSLFDGHSYHQTKDSISAVLCVRGGPLVSSNFSRNDTTEIVTDTATGLQWQDNEIVKTTDRPWTDAIDYCENTLTLGGHNDWRLPNVKELLSIADRSQYDPAMDTSASGFQNVPWDDFWSSYISDFWSSTTYARSSDYAWFVRFNYGYSEGYSKNYNRHVRCVRGGQLESSNFNPAIIMYLLN